MMPGERLRAWYVAKGWTVYRMAAEMKCSRQAVWEWVTMRRRPHIWRRDRIEALTGIPAIAWGEASPLDDEQRRAARESGRARYQRRRDAGVCVDCETPTRGTARCEGCLSDRRKPRRPKPPKRSKPTRRKRAPIRRAPSWIETWREMRRAS